MKKITTVLITSFLIIASCAKSSGEKPSAQNEFKEILNENTLDHWDGNTDHWKFEDGILTGETTPDNIIIEHSFFIWNQELPRDFELKLEYRISDRGNSGINYRSERVPEKAYDLKGYQADIDGKNEYTGQLYEEKGRAFLAHRGQTVYIDPQNNIHQLGSLEGDNELLEELNEEWNSYHIIAKGNTFIHLINGRVMSITLDYGSNFKKEGLLGFQLHLGPPMKVELRKILYKAL